MSKTIKTIGSDFEQTVDFNVLKAPRGIPIHLQTQVEEIRTKGVNGTVYRDVGKQYEPFIVIGYKFFTSFGDAVNHRNNMELLLNSFITLSTDEHGVHENIIIRSVESRPMAGTGVGDGVPAGTVAYVRTTFTMVKA